MADGQGFVACVSVDGAAVIRDANHTAHLLTGHRRLVGMHLSRLVPWRLHGRFYARFVRQLRSGASRTVRLPLLRADGTETVADLTIHILARPEPTLEHRAAQLV